ncbi:MAG: hypothetical protein IPJ98_00570 [Bryobacterales bacterium]|nr:hypothetical protein [Bryobacterales bacterium]
MRRILLFAAGLLVVGTWPSGARVLALGLTGLLVLGLLVAPQPAHGQFGTLLAGLTSAFNYANQAIASILSFFDTVMRPLLEAIRSAAQRLQSFLVQLRDLWERVVWPIEAIQGARSLAQRLIATFRALMNGLYSVGVNSAQLPNPTALEAVMRNRQVNDQSALADAYARTFGALPAPADVHPEERNLIDLDDSMAIDQLMTLKMAEAGADRALQAAEAIENEATRVAPGTAAMVSAAAYIAAVQSQAHLQKMIAGQLRQEAARLAHDTMTVKRGSHFARESRRKITDLSR